MNTFDDFQQSRVLRNAAITLRQENDGTVLGPVSGVLAKKVIVIGTVLESLAFLGIILYFILGPGDLEKQMILMIGLLFAVGAALAASVVGAVVYDKTLVQQKRRFYRDANGEITVKNSSGGDVVLSGEKPVFSVESITDRNNREIHDLFLRYGRDSHYILSGFDRDDMLRLRDSLQGACET